MSASGGVPVKAEDAGELVLDGGGVGEHAVGPGPAPDAGVEQDGLADAGQFAGLGGAAAHEVGELEGEHAGEDVDDDVVLGPVEITPGVYRTAGPASGRNGYFALLKSTNTHDIVNNNIVRGPARSR